MDFLTFIQGKKRCFMDFSATGRYDVIYQHMLIHKYYINQTQTEEIPMAEAIFRENYEELVSRMDDYIAEFDANGTDNLVIATQD